MAEEQQSDTLDFFNRLMGNRSFAEQERTRNAPAVTPSSGTGGSSLLSSLRAQLGESYQQQSPRDRFNDQLTNFGLSLMTSSNPRFLGAVGEAVNAQRESARQRNEDMRKLLESESEAGYREGQLSVAQAEQRLREAKQRYDERPDNPANRLALANAESALAHAEYYRRSAANVGRVQPHYVTAVDPQTGRTSVIDVTTGRERQLPENLRIPSNIPRASAGEPYILGNQVVRPMSDGSTIAVTKPDGTPVTPQEFTTMRAQLRHEAAREQELRDWANDRREVATRLSVEQARSNGVITEAQVQRALRDWDTLHPRPGTTPAQQQQTTTDPNTIVRDMTNR